MNEAVNSDVLYASNNIYRYTHLYYAYTLCLIKIALNIILFYVYFISEHLSNAHTHTKKRKE